MTLLVISLFRSDAYMPDGLWVRSVSAKLKYEKFGYNSYRRYATVWLQADIT